VLGLFEEIRCFEPSLDVPLLSANQYSVKIVNSIFYAIEYSLQVMSIIISGKSTLQSNCGVCVWYIN